MTNVPAQLLIGNDHYRPLASSMLRQLSLSIAGRTFGTWDQSTPTYYPQQALGTPNSRHIHIEHDMQFVFYIAYSTANSEHANQLASLSYGWLASSINGLLPIVDVNDLPM
jgi:hypothetical protein